MCICYYYREIKVRERKRESKREYGEIVIMHFEWYKKRINEGVEYVYSIIYKLFFLCNRAQANMISSMAIE